MDIKQLQLFLASAETLSFTEAAQQCFTVQSAVSQQISALEKELGVPLFLRERRTLRLTPEGEVFYKEAQAVLAQLNHARYAVQSAQQGYRETLHIGRQGDLLRSELPPVLRRLLTEHPSLRLNMMRGNTQELTDALQKGTIDCMITVFFPEHRLCPWIDFSIIRRESLRVMIASDHPLAVRGRVAVSDLSSIPMILLAGSDKSAHIASMVEAGYTDSHTVSLDSQNSIEQLVAAGCGCSPMAASACRLHPSLTYLELEDAPSCEIALVWNRERVSPPLRSLIHLLTQQAP